MYEQLRKELEADEKWDRLYWCEEKQQWGFMAEFGDTVYYWNSLSGDLFLTHYDIFGFDSIISRHKTVLIEEEYREYCVTPKPGYLQSLKKVIAKMRLIDPNYPWRISENISK